MRDFSDRLRDHFFNPRNAGVLGDANAVGEAGSLESGDALKLMLRVNASSGVIEAVRFQAFGSGPAIAASSALTELVTGKTIEEARKITAQDIVAHLGGLPPEKMHCPVMGQEALSAALTAWEGEARKEPGHTEGAQICTCFGVGRDAIERAIRTNKLTTPEIVGFYTKAGGGCSSCHDPLVELLAEVNAAMVAEGELLAADAFAPGAASTAAVTPVPPARPVQIRPAVPLPFARDRTSADETIAVSRIIEDLRPIFHADGGDVTLLDISGNRVSVKMTGACAGCQIASLTLGGLRKRIIAELGREVFVVPVSRN